jgi:NADH:ubiquinone reductase (H+-translocating)
MPNEREIKLDVAILGGGFAGVNCARTLERTLGRRAGGSVGLIAAENYMVFQPMLAEVVGGSISPRHVVNPLRLLCRRTQIFKGEVEGVLWPEKKLRLNAGDFSGSVEIHFKRLVLALGAVVDLSRIPGMSEHAFLMRNVGDAMLLRATMLSRLEEANLEPRPEARKRMTTFVVVGGGYSGVETAAQLSDLHHGVRHFFPNIQPGEFQVYLVHSQDHLLPTLRPKLCEYTARDLTARGIKLLLNQRVKAVTASRVCLDDGSSIGTHTVVCTVGNSPHPLVARLSEQNGFKTEKGRIVTEATGRVDVEGLLWAAGDCAAFPFPQGGFCPQTGQFGMRQGILVGRNIAASMAGKPVQPFVFKGLGELASLGHRRAVAEIMGFGFSGFIAWWLWRTIYLFKLPRIDRKIRVMLDWTLDLFFPRDLNVLNPRYSSVLREMYLEQGDVLFHAGEPAFSLYIVKRGRIEIFDGHGVMQTVTAGEYFGERALLGDKIWNFDARAAEPSALVAVPDRVFQQMVSAAGSLGALFRKSAGKYHSREIVASMTARLPESIRDRMAKDLMARHVRTLNPGMTVREALAITKQYPHGCYPLVNGDGRVSGVVNREDFYEFLKQPDTTGETRLERLPPAMLPTVPLDCPIEGMFERLVRGGASKLLVLEGDGRLAGMVTMMDLVTAVQSAQTEAASATAPN